MPGEGGCFCGAVRYKYAGDAQAKALCHCRDCQKIGGSPYSTNIIVPGEGFEVISGTPKTFAKKADDTGNEITSYFCGDCGSTMYRGGATFGDAKVIKVGTLDDTNAFEKFKPAIELYAGGKPSWVSKVSGADQKKGMPDSESIDVGIMDKIKDKLSG